ncbi:MAG: TonB family protein [Myxococcota bacterium]|nr:TonB family protein [Myxococcota bacterium]
MRAQDSQSTVASQKPKLTKPPSVIQFIEAEYPVDAKAKGVEAQVTLALTVNADGQADDIQVITSAGTAFDQAAISAVKQFKFSPAEVDGNVAPVRIQYTYNFTLRKAVDPSPETGPNADRDSTTDIQRDNGRLVGRLVLKGYRTPLVGFEVKLSTGVQSFTDEAGRFSFENVPAGTIVVSIDQTDFFPIKSEETVSKGKETDVTYFVERKSFDDSVVVVGKRVKKDVVKRTIRIEEIRLIPGTNGDALSVIQNLPGAARTPFGNTDLILRGGGRTQAYLNQQLIPIPFHFGGLRSTVSSALISDIQIYPSNFGVEYGRINGGVVNVQLREPRRDAIHGFVEADVFDAGLLLEMPVGDSGGLAIAFRRSYFDAILAVALPADSAVSLPTAPRYYDAQILYTNNHGRHAYKILAYGSSDRVVALLSEANENNPQARGNARLALEWVGGQLEWRYRFSPNLNNTLNLSYLTTSTEASFGSTVDLDFLFHQVLVRDTLNWTLSDRFKLRVGLDADILWSQIDAYGSGGPPKEGQPTNASGLEETIGIDLTDFLPSPATWLELQAKWGPVLFVPGLRLDYLAPTDEYILQPRVTTRWQTTEDLVLKAGYGFYAQTPEGDEFNEGLGNPNIKSERGWHLSAGAEYKFTDSLGFDGSIFYKDFDRLVRRVDDQTVRVDNQGVGRAYGLELLLRQTLTSRFFGWIAYTLQRSERRDSPTERWRLFDTDQTHNLILVAQYKLTRKWTLGLRFRYVTGNPDTPVEGTIYEADADRFVPLYGDTNSERFDDFHQLDLRIDREWTFDTWRLTAYLDVRNVYNRANASARTYNYDYSESMPRFEIPVVPSFGLRGEF